MILKINANNEYRYQFNGIKEGLCWFENVEELNPSSVDSPNNFGFRIESMNESSIVISRMDIPSNELITLNINQEISLNVGEVIYTLLLMEELPKEEKITLRKFRTLMIESDMSLEDSSIYAPIVYAMDYDYYIAAKRFMEEGIITHLEAKGINIENIMYAFGVDKASYLKALLVLNNIKNATDNEYAVLIEPFVIE